MLKIKNYWSNTPYKAVRLFAGKMDNGLGTAAYPNSLIPGAFSAILKENKSILIQGFDNYAQKANGAPSSSLLDLTPTKFYNVVSCSLGGLHGGYIDDSARFFIWGSNPFNQLGNNAIRFPEFVPTESILSKDGNKLKINKIECGVRHTLALAEDGTLFATGFNGNGQLGRGNTVSSSVFITVISSSVTDIASGWSNSYIISGGFLCSAGANNFAQCGDGTTTQRTTFTRTTGSATNIIELSGGAEHCLYIKDDYSLWGFGRNNLNQLITSSAAFASSSIHRRITPLSASKCSAGFSNSAFITTDNNLYAGGTNTFGQLGTGNYNTTNTASLIDTNVVDVACGITYTIYEKTDGSVWFAGSNAFGQSGLTNTLFYNPKLIVAQDVASASVGNNNTFFIKTDNTLWAMGKNDTSQMGSVVSSSQQTVPIQVSFFPAQDVGVGTGHSIFIRDIGAVLGTGLNSSGQLGTGTTTARTSYGTLTGAGTCRKVSCGANSSFVIRSSGNPDDLYAAGANGNGQLGINSTTNATSWTFVTSSVSDVQSFGAHTAFIISGSLYTMGLNTNGQLGDGTTTQRTVPTFITGSVKKLARSPQSAHTMFIKTDNTLWGMGANNAGQLGTGNTTSYSRSIQIDTDVVDVTVAGGVAVGYTLYTKTDGSVYGMGCGTFGNLTAILTGSINSTPVKLFDSNSPLISTKSSSIALAGTAFTMLLVDSGSALYGFGNNDAGQIGDGIATTNLTPIRIYP